MPCLLFMNLYAKVLITIVLLLLKAYWFMYTLKIRRVRDSLGVILPKEALQKLRVRQIDNVFVTETPSNTQTACNPDFAKAMEAYRKVINIKTYWMS